MLEAQLHMLDMRLPCSISLCTLQASAASPYLTRSCTRFSTRRARHVAVHPFSDSLPRGMLEAAP